MALDFDILSAGRCDKCGHTLSDGTEVVCIPCFTRAGGSLDVDHESKRVSECNKCHELVFTDLLEDKIGHGRVCRKCANEVELALLAERKVVA